jgi:hypothetical protein
LTGNNNPGGNTGPFGLNFEVDVFKTAEGSGIPNIVPNSAALAFQQPNQGLSGAIWMWSNNAGCNTITQQLASSGSAGFPLGTTSGMPNSWRFDPHVLSAAKGEILLVVMGAPVGLGQLGTNYKNTYFDSYRALSVLGGNYNSRTLLTSDENLRSLPRY